MVRELAGRYAWKVTEQQATGWVDHWITRTGDEADDTPTGLHVRRRADALAASR